MHQNYDEEKTSDRFRFERLEAVNTIYKIAANTDEKQDYITDSKRFVSLQDLR